MADKDRPESPAGGPVPNGARGTGPAEEPTVRLDAGEGAVRPGRLLAGRYRVEALLGRGGMGEVWRAHDLKLRVDVVLKALRPALPHDPRRLELLRREVRAARRVFSPHVCRIYGLEDVDGLELVSMELVDGDTLGEVLRARGPLDLREALDVASQFLAGLDAIHAAGLVHRDIKPDNIMLTRAGRVVVMDFGLARESAGAAHPVAGTPAYMAPEQLRGGPIDARADVFAAGMVLAEMVACRAGGDDDEREALRAGLRAEPCRPPEGPWAPVIRQAVAPEPRNRHEGARALARALEEASLRVSGAEEATPYPGLVSFTEDDSAFFFGREAEVERMWRRLEEPPRLLAVVGPSGAGKTSFLNAGVVPAAPEGWGILRCTPGTSPPAALRGALAAELARDTGELRALMEHPGAPDAIVRACAAWRRRHEHAVLVIDQFEELFTLNGPAVQASFARLLGRLPLVADLRVVLGLRDDFLMHCHAHPDLAPVFGGLTPLGPLTGDALRRALTQPAARCGYHFENGELVDDMVDAVADERGALPLLAFAAARLWERRDREEGHLTRAAYEEFGGVGGALARHAEATLERIGAHRRATVRELFRNLLTADGTRAVRDVDELLSVFDDREAAAEVLRALVDARLLTSFEQPATDGTGVDARVEIIHESLLAHWPRLQRWRTQDAEGAQLRDELRQSARLWDQRGRTDDLLWTGTAFREFRLWRERYRGGLTRLEEDFASAMTAAALRRRRRRRSAVGGVVLLAVIVAAATSALWRRSEAARRLARSEARHAEAAEVLALARARQQEDPTEALAYATASLELADSEEARVFAVRLLWESPPALEVPTGGTMNFLPDFSPDGRRLAVGGNSDEVRVWTADGPGKPVVLPGHPTTPRMSNATAWVADDLLATGNPRVGGPLRVWAFPGGERAATIDPGGAGWFSAGAGTLFTATDGTSGGRRRLRLRAWPAAGGEPRELGTVDPRALGASQGLIAPGGRGWVYARGTEVRLHRPGADAVRGDTLLGRHPVPVDLVDRLGDGTGRVFSSDRAGGIRVWEFAAAQPRLARTVPAPESGAVTRMPDPSGRWAASLMSRSGRRSLVWDLAAWPQARPLDLRRGASHYASNAAFHPDGDWLVTTTHSGHRLTFFPLRGERPVVVAGYEGFSRPLAFTPDGRWLATVWSADAVRLWPLPGARAREPRRLPLPRAGGWSDLAVDPRGRFVFLVGNGGEAWVVPLDGSAPRRLDGFSRDTLLHAAAVSPDGRRVATAFGYGLGPEVLLVWDLARDRVRRLELPEGSDTTTGFEQGVWTLAFVDGSTLYSAGDGGVRRWDLGTGGQTLVFASEPGHAASLRIDLRSRTGLVVQRPLETIETRDGHTVALLDLATGASRPRPRLGRPRTGRSLHLARGVYAVGDMNGILRTGRLGTGEPHLLGGHEGPVDHVAVSPDGRWLASTGQDNTLRLWPMPDLSAPPPHTLPRDTFVARLKALTNLRAVRDEDASEGWTIELAPFPGWRRVPTWDW